MSIQDGAELAKVASSKGATSTASKAAGATSTAGNASKSAAKNSTSNGSRAGGKKPSTSMSSEGPKDSTTKKNRDKDKKGGPLRGLAANTDGDNQNGNNQPDANSEQAQDTTKKDMKKAATAAGMAANMGAKGTILASAFNMMNMLMITMQAGIASIAQGATGLLAGLLGGIQSIGTAIASGVSAIVGSVVSAGSFIAGALGVSSVVGTSIASGAILAVISGSLVVGMSVVNTSMSGVRDGRIIDCADILEVSVNEDGSVDVNAKQLEYAQKVYSILSVYGLDNKQIAGVLGNYTAESGIDPTTIEGIYGDSQRYLVTTKVKQEALKDLSKYTQNTLFPLYDESGAQIHKPAYKAVDGKYYPGIGLAQWTGNGAMNLINTAEELNRKWYELDFQLAYMLAKGAPTGYRNFWERYAEMDFATPEEAGIFFAVNFEGNPYHSEDENRLNASKLWFNQLDGWSVDGVYAESVIGMAAAMGGAAIDKESKKELDKCVKAQNYDNSSIAEAVTSYAYPQEDMGYGNDGTSLYQRVHDVVFPGDIYYQSCDRGAATGIRWSGADITFPAGNTASQYKYITTSSKWTYIGTDITDPAELMPGDVFITPLGYEMGHIFVYVGNEVVQRIHGSDASPDGDMVSASYGQRSPGVSYYDIGVMIDYDERTYEVYRNTDPDNSDKYADAGASVNGSK